MQNHGTVEESQTPCLFALLFVQAACRETDSAEPAPSEEREGVAQVTAAGDVLFAPDDTVVDRVSEDVDADGPDASVVDVPPEDDIDGHLEETSDSSNDDGTDRMSSDVSEFATVDSASEVAGADVTPSERTPDEVSVTEDGCTAASCLGTVDGPDRTRRRPP